jgi:hypothetical protein
VPPESARIRQILDDLKANFPASYGEYQMIAEDLDALDAKLEAAERERAHRGEPVSIERIKEAHSSIRESWLQQNVPGHPVYKQGHNEECYFCALIFAAEAAERERDDLRLLYGAKGALEEHLVECVDAAERRAERLTEALKRIAQSQETDPHDARAYIRIAREALAAAEGAGDGA